MDTKTKLETVLTMSSVQEALSHMDKLKNENPAQYALEMQHGQDVLEIFKVISEVK